MKGLKGKKPEAVTQRRALIDLGADRNGLVHILRRFQLSKGAPSRKPDQHDPDRFDYNSSERLLAGMGGVVKADGLLGFSSDARDYFTGGGGVGA